MPYYRPAGPYEGVDSRLVTKRLIFSNWAVVPRAISAVLSYEAERRIFQSYEEKPENTVEARKKRKPLLQFAYTNDRLTGMPVLGLIYPSFTLARLGDPFAAAWVDGANGRPSLEGSCPKR